VPEQHSNYSLFGPVCTENEQNVDPQISVVKDHQFGAPGEASQNGRCQLHQIGALPLPPPPPTFLVDYRRGAASMVKWSSTEAIILKFGSSKNRWYDY